jgi:sugar (pentulose or hexulose) kinase
VNYIALDIGSSFLKAAVLDLNRCAIGPVAKLPTPARLPSASSAYYELDPDAIMSCVTALIEPLLLQEEGIAGIVLATQMHGFLLGDDQGQPVTPYISWRDERCLEAAPDGSGSYIDYLRTLIEPAQLRSTGIDLKPGLALCNLFHWLQINRLPDQPNVRFFTLGSYIIYKLTGRHFCHLTNAAATGFVDIHTGTWNRHIIQAAGCQQLVFPAITHEADIGGLYESGHGPIAVYPDIGDHQASVLGSLAADCGDVVLTVGTAGILTRIGGRSPQGAYEARPYFNGELLHTITRLPGGRNLDVLIQFLQDIGRTVFDSDLSSEHIWAKILPAAQQYGD